MSTIKDELIVRQQKQINELRTRNRQLEEDNLYIKKVLSIALRDYLRDTPLVISKERITNTTPEFSLDENMGGDTLLWAAISHKRKMEN